ncbi:hypothetical protein JCM10908_004199 [Rhodotorula pacifica]|uniref:uncharacterized protein n=1 Tax=Rhodotorula pacifica TaxID=1495444 RepID=UPI0031707323
MSCESCGGVDTLEYSPELGTLACTRCGTVSTSSASHAFEYLARVDEEDQYQNGRHYISAGALSGEYGALGAMQIGRGGRANNWARATGESRQIYQSQKRTESDRFIRRVLTRFGLQQALFERVQFIFRLARDKIAFRWGRKAEIYAAACIYAAAMESKKDLQLVQLANAIDAEDLFTLTRAVKIVKYELKLKFEENEPALFIEALLLHLNRLFSPNNAPTTSTSKAAGLPWLHAAPPSTKKYFSRENVTWLRSLSLTAVRTMTSGLLAFATETDFVQQRMPQNIACAVVLVALEGVARTPAPGLTEFIDEFAFTVGIKSFTIGERYRQLCAALAEYAPRLPWLAGKTFAVGDDNDDDDAGASPVPVVKKRGRPPKGVKVTKTPSKRGWKRALVAYTNDIVQWRRSLDAKQNKMARENAVAERERERADSVALRPWDDEPSPGGSRPPEPDADDEEEGAYFADPVFSGTSAAMYRLDNGSSAMSSPSAEDSPAPPDLPPDGIGDPAPQPTQMRRKRGRPAEIDESISPAEQAVTGDKPFTSSSAPRLRDELEMRQLLLAGHSTADVLAHMGAREDQYQKQLVDPAKPSSRLERLQWYKPVDNITADEDLFDEGELESYLRPKSEVEDLLKLPATKEMLTLAEKQEAASKDKPKRAMPPRRWRGRAFSRKVSTNVAEWSAAERAAAGLEDGESPNFTEIEIGDRGEWGCFGPSHTKRRRVTKRADTAETDGFTARPKKTKMTAERKQQIEALLAMKGLGDSDDDEYAGSSDDEAAWLDQAVEVAREEGEAVDTDDADDADGAEEMAEEEDPSGGDDWRAQMGYPNGQEEDGDAEQSYDD